MPAFVAAIAGLAWLAAGNWYVKETAKAVGLMGVGLVLFSASLLGGSWVYLKILAAMTG